MGVALNVLVFRHLILAIFNLHDYSKVVLILPLLILLPIAFKVIKVDHNKLFDKENVFTMFTLVVSLIIIAFQNNKFYIDSISPILPIFSALFFGYVINILRFDKVKFLILTLDKSLPFILLFSSLFYIFQFIYLKTGIFTAKDFYYWLYDKEFYWDIHIVGYYFPSAKSALLHIIALVYCLGMLKASKLEDKRVFFSFLVILGGGL